MDFGNAHFLFVALADSGGRAAARRITYLPLPLEARMYYLCGIHSSLILYRWVFCSVIQVLCMVGHGQCILYPLSPIKHLFCAYTILLRSLNAVVCGTFAPPPPHPTTTTTATPTTPPTTYYHDAVACNRFPLLSKHYVFMNFYAAWWRWT